MNFRLMGRTGLRVSELCFGTMTFGPGPFDLGGVEQHLATRIVEQCLDAGVNFFDTADVYSDGLSEQMLSKALGHRRRDVIVATKVAGPIQPPNRGGSSRHHIMNSVEKSLRNLNTDYIDLYQLHIWDDFTALEETLRALDDLVAAGKVRYIGCSNYSAWHVTKALWVSDRHSWVRFETMQMQYSLTRREIENEHIPLCADQSLSVLPWSPLAGGFLTGKFRRGQARPSAARRGDVKSPLNQLDFLKVDEERAFKIIDTLDGVTARVGATHSQVALAWLLRKPAVTSVIIGARTIEQLCDNLGAVNVKLSNEDMQELDAASATPALYPYSMTSFMRSIR